jgi:hypothetical protein
MLDPAVVWIFQWCRFASRLVGSHIERSAILKHSILREKYFPGIKTIYAELFRQSPIIGALGEETRNVNI